MITRAIRAAYLKLHERKWDTVYWAIDLHGTVFPSTHQRGNYQFINESARRTLRFISKLPETKIILWSSLGDVEWPSVVEFFKEHGIRVDYCNENPEVANTDTGCFDKKFYFSILVDDKAGFSPDDWTSVGHCVQTVSLNRLKYSNAMAP